MDKKQQLRSFINAKLEKFVNEKQSSPHETRNYHELRAAAREQPATLEDLEDFAELLIDLFND